MTAEKASWLGLRLEPLDTLFFRDGRPFDASARAVGGLPYPQPVAGALRTALLARAGFDFSRFAHLQRHEGRSLAEALQACGAPGWVVETRFRGPWLALWRPGPDTVEPVLAVPATLARVPGSKREEPGRWVRADPLREAPPGWQCRHGLLPVWHRGPTEAKYPGGFLTLRGIEAFLQGGQPTDADWFEPGDLYEFDVRTGIAINADTLTAAESQIYGIHLLALRPRVKKQGSWQEAGVCLYAEVLPGPGGSADLREWLTGPIALGGEGRYVRGAVGVPTVRWPGLAGGSEGAAPRTLCLLGTPGLFGGSPGADCWRPDPILAAQLQAAASREPLAVSGWDIARNGPRPTRFAVPAGSVYFVEGPFNPPQESLCADAEDVAQGWGFVLRGTWNYA
jgi:CRISPR-associated protein Cmr3